MAEDLARSSGTPEDVLKTVLGQEFLMKCLRKAKFSPDLLQDTADACEINDLNALVLGSGLLSVSEASEKLFLMQDEASTVVAVCRKECLRAGVNFGDGAQLTAEELAEKDDEEPAPPAPQPSAPPPPPAPSAPVQPAAVVPPPAAPVIYVQPAANHKQPGKISPREKKPQKLGSKAVSVPLPPPAAAQAASALQPFPSAPTNASSMLPKPMASRPPEPATKEPPKEPLKELPKEPSKELSKEAPKEPSKQLSKEHSKELSSEPSREFSSEPSREVESVSRRSSLTPPVLESVPRRSMTTTPSVEQQDPNFLIKPPVNTTVQGQPPTNYAFSGTPVASRSHIPKPGGMTPATPGPGGTTPRDRIGLKPMIRAPPAMMATPPTSTGGASDSWARPTPAMNGRHTPAASSSAAKPPRPSSAPLSARAASTTIPLGKDRSSSALMTTPVPASRLPSYAKPTASHKARVTKEDSDVPSSSSPPPVTFASTNKPLRRIHYLAPRPTTSPEEKKEPKKPVFDNIRSNLLRPTAAFLAWSSGKSKAAKEVDFRASQSLQGDAISQPSRARAPNSAPPKSAARELSATTGTALSPSVMQGNTKVVGTTPEPFRLASAERHQKAQEELAKKKEEKARLESHIPKFRASPMPGSVERNSASAKAEAKRSSTAQTDV